MNFLEWLAWQRKINAYYRPFEEADELRYLEALLVTAHEQVEKMDQSLTFPKVSDCSRAEGRRQRDS